MKTSVWIGSKLLEFIFLSLNFVLGEHLLDIEGNLFFRLVKKYCVMRLTKFGGMTDLQHLFIGQYFY